MTATTVHYRERPSTIAGAITWSAYASAAESKRVLPDGCMDLLWLNDTLTIAGPDTGAHVARSRPGETVVGVRMPAAVGPAVFGLPAYEVRDVRVPLDAVWPGGDVRRLGERVAGAADTAAMLEAVIESRLRDSGPDPTMRYVAELLGHGVDVASVAHAVGYSERQLHRRARAAFGYGPKTLSRIYRFERALEAVRAGVAQSDAARRAGYADQAHLARESRALAGFPLPVLLS